MNRIPGHRRLRFVAAKERGKFWVRTQIDNDMIRDILQGLAPRGRQLDVVKGHLSCPEHKISVNITRTRSQIREAAHLRLAIIRTLSFQVTELNMSSVQHRTQLEVLCHTEIDELA